MRRTTLGVVLATVLIAGTALATPESQPRLAFVSVQPVVVTGSNFRPYERVRLLVSPGPSPRAVRAGALGRFRVGLRLSMPRCGGIVVQAIGSGGSRAMVDRTGPDCAPID